MKGFACLKKQESLTAFDSGDKKISDLILNDLNPYPGYYSETPGDNVAEKPKLAFLILKLNELHSEDKILRNTYSFKKELNFDFEANYGRLTLHNKIYPCIRIITGDLSNIPLLLEKFKSRGLLFEKTKEVKKFDSHIDVRKYIELEEIERNVYKGIMPNHFYLEVSKKLKWEDFVKLIRSVKGSLDYKSFDAAQISLYLKDCIIEFIRIYTENMNNDDLVKLRNDLEKQQMRY